MKYLLVAVLTAAVITVCSTEGCGSGPAPAAGRIVGGVLATENYPWQVALLYRRRFTCGGSIIADFWVVTAAHCVSGRNIKKFRVAYGTLDYNNRRTTRIGSISSITMHSDYNPLNFTNDIALLKLKSRLEFNSVVGKVCIPTIPVPDDSIVRATGFGLLAYGGSSSQLYQVDIPVVSGATCAATYQGYPFDHDSFICAGTRGKGICSGDSGGPVMYYKNNRWELHGVVNAGPTNCISPIIENIGIHARANYFRDWIHNNCEQCL